VRNVQHLEQSIEHLFSELLLSNTFDQLAGRLHLERQLESLLDRQRRQMDVV
jgi:hypothetical protein